MHGFLMKNSTDMNLHFGTTLSENDVQFLGKQVWERAIDITAKLIAEEFIKKHGQEVLAKLDPQAIANLSVAQAGAAIRETLEKKLPSSERIVEKAVVYQRGIFGGIRRV